MSPATLWVVITGQIIKNIGCIPGSYIIMAMFADCLDHFELKHKFRCDGFAMSLYSIIMTVAAGLGPSIFNLILGQTGYIKPELIDGVTVAMQQPEAVLNGILWSYYGIELIGTAIIVVLFFFLNPEKKLRLARQQEALAVGQAPVSEDPAGAEGAAEEKADAGSDLSERPQDDPRQGE